MRILKFGGTSLADAETMARVAAIVQGASVEGPVAMVVSALGGITNALLDTIAAAVRRDDDYRALLTRVVDHNRQCAREVAPNEGERELLKTLEVLQTDLEDLLHGVYLLREASPRTRDAIVAFGERMSAPIVAAALRTAGVLAEAVDAREFIVTDDTYGNAQVDFAATEASIQDFFKGREGVAVVTGFIARGHAEQTTTLGRGGSDLTASLLGAALDAKAVELWTDVSGVYSADPRLVPDAFPIPTLSFAELMELSHFGAKVVHPPSVFPARKKGIPLLIKNTFEPEAKGTRVVEHAPASPFPIRGLTSIQRVALMRLEGDGMIGIPGIAARLFSALASYRVNVILISQASSEHSICFAVAPEQAEAARRATDGEFKLEIQLGLVAELVIEDNLCVVAAVGEEMRRRAGLAGRMFSVLGEEQINVRAIAQGSSERNISLVIAAGDETRALSTMHGAFFSTGSATLDLVVAGVGRVGLAFLKQLEEEGAELAKRGQEIRVVGLANSRRMLADPAGLDLAKVDAQMAGGEPVDFVKMRVRLANRRTRMAFVDCTASDQTGSTYPEWLGHGVSVVAANKRPFVSTIESYREMYETASRQGASIFCETTVGAGLPVISTLTDLLATGDQVLRINGVLSGTCNALLNWLHEGVTFSEAVRMAHAQGLTEPKPWEDLSGEDVARKLCILARTIGLDLELRDVQVEPMLPGDGWDFMELDRFFNRLTQDADSFYADRLRRAEERGERLRYLAEVEDGQARVKLTAVSSDHPAYALAGPDNLLAFTTKRYSDLPLVMRGPGAGPEVTAAGVFTDVLRVARRRWVVR